MTLIEILTDFGKENSDSGKNFEDNDDDNDDNDDNNDDDDEDVDDINTPDFFISSLEAAVKVKVQRGEKEHRRTP